MLWNAISSVLGGPWHGPRAPRALKGRSTTRRPARPRSGRPDGLAKGAGWTPKPPNGPSRRPGERIVTADRGRHELGRHRTATLIALADGPGPVVDGDLDADGASLRSEAR